ncbi:MAG: choice-of-anchor D domain-containing protein, partial [Verrucomicrobia bacterium]|nr:choice-of-anchor D domain-containing protein [Verrucomicrobiota bacterium]
PTDAAQLAEGAPVLPPSSRLIFLRGRVHRPSYHALLRRTGGRPIVGYTMAASGNGTITPTRVISLSGDLVFGSVVVGSSAQRTLTIANTGNSTLTVSSISYPSGFGGNWSSGTIPAGGSQNVTVTFSPSAATGYDGTVTVNSDKTSGVNTIAASGLGMPVSNGFVFFDDMENG